MTKNSSSPVLDMLGKIILNVIIVLGITMLIVALAHVFWRYALNNALTWSEELLKMMMAWFSLLSATIISRRSEHIGIVIFREMLPVNLQRFFLKAVRYITLMACLIVTAAGTYLVIKTIGQRSPSLRIPYSLAYASIPVSFIIMSIYEIVHIKNGNFMEDTIKIK